MAVRRQRRPADPESKANPNVLASRSLCPAGQGEGDTGAVIVAMAQPARRIDAVEEATNQAPA